MGGGGLPRHERARAPRPRKPDDTAVETALSTFELITSSRLLQIELHRLGMRAGVTAEEIEAWLAPVALVPIDDDVLVAAESVRLAAVATLDAIHLATALGLAAGEHIEAIMTFGQRLAEGAHEHDLAISAPS